MLGAGDDFLSGVATLTEADAVQEIEIEHLRDESLARRQIYLRQTGANVREAPVMFDPIRLGNIAGQSMLRQLVRCPDHPVTAGVPVDCRNTDVVRLGVA